MTYNPLVLIGRALSLRRHASHGKTGFTPLSGMDSAAVYIDADAPDAAECAVQIRDYFTANKITVEVFAMSADRKHSQVSGAVLITPKGLNWFGRPKRTKRSPKIGFGEKLCINLVGRECFAAEYCVRCSKALFKVGRTQTKGKLYDLLLNSEGYPQTEVFRQIVPLLESVR